MHPPNHFPVSPGGQFCYNAAPMNRLTLCCLLIASLLTSGRPAAAWDGHGLITRVAIQEVEWLDQIPPVKVTPWKDTIVGIRQDYKFPFREEKPGDLLPARKILELYAMEPDEGPDQELNVSWQQKFMGGYKGLSSRGYFHMFYPGWTVHLPVPGIEMGAAPDRSQLWYDKSLEAFDRKDPYWGFRYLSCALHYLEDVGQPFHSTQTSRRFVVIRKPIEGTTKVTKNYHLAYELWVAVRMLRDELDLLKPLKGTDSEDFESPASAVRKVARLSHKHSAKLFKACIDFFDRRFMAPVDVPATEADQDQLEPVEARNRIIEATRPALALTGRAIRGLLGEIRSHVAFQALYGQE